MKNLSDLAVLIRGQVNLPAMWLIDYISRISGSAFKYVRSKERFVRGLRGARSMAASICNRGGSGTCVCPEFCRQSSPNNQTKDAMKEMKRA
jgi:hypothetical protein